MRLPPTGSPVDSPEGPGHVIHVNMLTEICIVALGDGRHIAVPGEDIRALREERGPVRACKNHVKNGGSCGGAPTHRRSGGGEWTSSCRALRPRATTALPSGSVSTPG